MYSPTWEISSKSTDALERRRCAMKQHHVVPVLTNVDTTTSEALGWKRRPRRTLREENEACPGHQGNSRRTASNACALSSSDAAA